MSVKAMSAAFDTGDRLNLPAIDRLILLRLGDWADDYGYCFPGIADLVAKVGVDERTIRRHLTALEAEGLVSRYLHGGGRNRSTLYRMLPNVLPDLDKAPGKVRYLVRYKLKGDRESGFQKDRPGVTKPQKGTGEGTKRGRSRVPRSVSIHQDPPDDFSISEVEPLLPGESQWERVRRIARLDI